MTKQDKGINRTLSPLHSHIRYFMLSYKISLQGKNSWKIHDKKVQRMRKIHDLKSNKGWELNFL